MKYDFQASAQAAHTQADCVTVGVFKDGQLSTAAQQINDASQGALEQHLALGDFSGKKGQTSLLYQVPQIAAKRVLLVGLGAADKLNAERVAQAHSKAVDALKSHSIQTVVSFLSDVAPEDKREPSVQQAILAVDAGLYTFHHYKSKQDELETPEINQWTLAHTSDTDYSSAVQQGSAIAQGMRLTKDLGNMPGNVCTPAYLAETATTLATDFDHVTAEVLGEAQMEELGMGSFLSVSKGSVLDGKLIILNYQGGASDAAPIVLVGKGITFDTGGISLKQPAAMDEMKYDMGGAASVLGAFKACVLMGLPLNVITVVAAAENMPDGKASKPGDIVTSLSGQTIEILNTDAEGRLVLCDALTYVERFKPAAVIDVATLTGACITALGHHTSALMSNNDALAEDLLAASETSGDATWRLPLGEKYQEQLKSNFADMANIGGAPAGAITAGCFLARFTENYPWAHLDIAGVAWKSGAAKGSTGRPVPLLSQLLLNRSQAV